MKGPCLVCNKPLTGRKRKYCTEHSGRASLLWKREHRRQWKIRGEKYWLSDWKHKSLAEKRAYFAGKMREYRRRKASEE
jgi:hypothetical protein